MTVASGEIGDGGLAAAVWDLDTLVDGRGADGARALLDDAVRHARQSTSPDTRSGLCAAHVAVQEAIERIAGVDVFLNRLEAVRFAELVCLSQACAREGCIRSGGCRAGRLQPRQPYGFRRRGRPVVG